MRTIFLRLSKYLPMRRARDSVRYLVLDEADHLLNTDFAEQTEEIVASCTHPDVQKSMFSATLPSTAERVAKQTLVDPIRVVVGTK